MNVKKVQVKTVGYLEAALDKQSVDRVPVQAQDGSDGGAERNLERILEGTRSDRARKVVGGTVDVLNETTTCFTT